MTPASATGGTDGASDSAGLPPAGSTTADAPGGEVSGDPTGPGRTSVDTLTTDGTSTTATSTTAATLTAADTSSSDDSFTAGDTSSSDDSLTAGDTSSSDDSLTAGDTSSSDSTSTTAADELTTTAEEGSTGSDDDLYPEGWSIEVSPSVIDVDANSAGLFLLELAEAEDDSSIGTARVRRLDRDSGEEVADFDVEVPASALYEIWGTDPVQMAAADAGIVVSDQLAGRVHMFHPESGALVFETAFPGASVLAAIWSVEQDAIYAVVADDFPSTSPRVVRLSPVDGAQDPGFSFSLPEDSHLAAQLWVTSDRVWVWFYHGFHQEYLASADADSGGGMEEFGANIGRFFVVGDDVFRQHSGALWPIAADPDSPPLVDLGLWNSQEHTAVTDNAVLLGGSDWTVHKRSYPDWTMDPAFGQDGVLAIPPESAYLRVVDLEVYSDALYVLRRRTNTFSLNELFLDRRSVDNGSL